MIIPLNAFLLRRGLTPIDFVSASSLEYVSTYYWSGESFELMAECDRDLLGAAVPGDIVIMLHERAGSIPAWQVFLRQYLEGTTLGSPSRSTGAILFCAMPDGNQAGILRWVAWSFGSASKIIRRVACDPRFGLTVTLNAFASEIITAMNSIGDGSTASKGKPSFRMLKYRTTAPYFQQTGHQASRNIPIEGFRIDRFSDLVSAVGGRTNDSLFRHVSGGRSLQIKYDLGNIDEFIKLSIEVLSRSNLDHYREVFAWVDNIAVIEDDELVARLREELVSSLMRKPVPRHIDTILPDDLTEFENSALIQYVLMPRRLRRNACDLTLTPEMVARYLSHVPVIDRNRSLDDEVRFLDDAKTILGSATLLECLCSDFEFEHGQYILYDGNFYRVDKDLLQYIDEALDSVKVCDLDFPHYMGGPEPGYNVDIRDNHADQFIVLDGKLITLPGESGIEPCDLIGPAGQLIHVKRKGRSSVLSHLFAQVVNSCKILKRSAMARDDLRGKIQACSQSRDLTDSALREISKLEDGGSGVQVVFAFLGDWRGKSIKNLPLFSRIALVQAVESIELMGYEASVKLVGPQ